MVIAVRVVMVKLQFVQENWNSQKGSAEKFFLDLRFYHDYPDHFDNLHGRNI
jgi:hypothetical protein